VIERVLTIGAYGFTGETFIETLKAAGVDLFIDIRARRGMRGSAYAFANAQRLQAALEAAGIKYVHAKELSPSEHVREAQYKADAAAGVAKRQRTSLGDAFKAAYETECLSKFDPADFAKTYLVDCKRPVLFCVEREADACHRSLVAPRLAAAFAVPVEHLRPIAADALVPPTSPHPHTPPHPLPA